MFTQAAISAWRRVKPNRESCTLQANCSSAILKSAFALGLALLVLPHLCSAATHVIRPTCNYDGAPPTVFEFASDQGDRWNPIDGSSPSMSPAAAQEIARKYMENIPPPENSTSWTDVAQIKMTTAGANYWYYEVSFEAPSIGSDAITICSIPVRFDGTIPNVVPRRPDAAPAGAMMAETQTEQK